VESLCTGSVPQWSIGAPFGLDLQKRIEKMQPDIVNLHWINGGFLGPRDVEKIKVPIVWTLHDMWPITGGCHYSYDCRNFEESCGNCPQLHSRSENDWSRKGWERKSTSWEDKKFTVVTPSRWLRDEVRSSSLFGAYETSVIPYGIDLERFNDGCRLGAREKLGIPADKPCVLFGALSADSDSRKGYSLLKAGLEQIAEELRQRKVTITIFGGTQSSLERDPQTGLMQHSFGSISCLDELASLYRAADVFVAPSRADNLPNTVLEATACGTPTVAFEVGGMSDMIEHGKTGFLAQPFDTGALAKAVLNVIDGRVSRKDVRAKAEREFPELKQAEHYRTLYESVLDN